MTEVAPTDPRWVFDTNVLVSAALSAGSAPRRAVQLALRHTARLLMSVATLAELHEVLAWPKFDRYLSDASRHDFVRDLLPLVELVPASAPIRACRDPRDDKFLEVAVHGEADALVSGDQDLLALHPSHGVPIVTPPAFLGLFNPQDVPPPDRVQEPAPRYATTAFAPLPPRLAAFLRERRGLLREAP